MDIVWKNSMEELKSSNFKPKDKIFFVCSKCNKEQMLYYKTVTNKDYFICRACRGIKTQLDIREKDPNYGWFGHSGTAEWITSKEFKEKRKKTMEDKWGCEYTTQSPELRKKIDKTLTEKLGENYQEIIQKHREENNLKNFGVCIKGFQDKESKEKSKKTCLDKYGYEYTAQVPEIREKQSKSSKKKWKINIDSKKICFDSKYEIYYYFWLLDNGIEFEYNKKYHKKYLQKDGKLHPYYFDFHILSNDTYVELKGDCFFNEKDEPIGIAPYKGYDWTEKYNFLLSENIPIIKTSSIENGDLKYIKENFYNKHKDIEVYK